MLYPDLTIIAAHCGFPWFLELASVLARRPNVYVDVSALGVPALPDMLRQQVIFAFLGMGVRRVLFGTDFPAVRPSLYAPYVRKLRPSEAETNMIMGENAARLLKLDTTESPK